MLRVYIRKQKIFSANPSMGRFSIEVDEDAEYAVMNATGGFSRDELVSVWEAVEAAIAAMDGNAATRKAVRDGK